MNSDRHRPELQGGPACSAPHLAELLFRYDDLDPAARARVERHVDGCPACGPRWTLFHRVDAWLEQAGRDEERGCPAAEDLYDFGRGPGARPLSAERRDGLERHLAHCESCRALTATLRAPIPVPLDVAAPRTAPAAAPGPAPPHPRRKAAPRPRFRLFERVPLWAPVAAAAGLLVAVQLFTGGPTAGTDVAAGADEGVGSLPRNGFPELPVLRGDEGRALLWPRGKLLAPPEDGEEVVPRADLAFELAPVEGAELYRVRLRRHGGGAFEVGEPIEELEGPEPRLEAGHLALDPGHYTYEAWALVRGLERPLGERDFQVVHDRDLDSSWLALDDVPEPERGARRVALLHERGFLGAARALARTLPPSAERDAYLAAWPGR
jgi:hypothetical protein